jgi:hypothetical protein
VPTHCINERILFKKNITDYCWKGRKVCRILRLRIEKKRIPNRNPTIIQIYIKHVVAATFKIDKKHVEIICVQVHLTLFMDML